MPTPFANTLLRPGERAIALTGTDSSPVLLVKTLLYPVAAALTLVACVLAWRERLPGPYFLIAVLTFVAAADFLDVAPLGAPARSALAVLVDIVLRWTITVGFITVLLYLSGLHSQLNRLVLLSWALATPFVLWFGQLSAQHLLGSAMARVPQRNAVIVGITEPGLRLARELGKTPLLRIAVAGFFEDRHPSRVDAAASQGSLLGTTAELPGYIAHHAVSVVYITLPMTRDVRILKLLDALKDSTVSIYFVPDVFVFNLIQPRFDLLNGVPLLAVLESPFFGFRGLAKRLTDIVIGSLALALLAPLFAVLAVGVRVSSPGPVLFRQRRYGLDGKQIAICKFRSMTVVEDGDKTYTQVARGDPRVTAFGAFMRKSSLDELPQLLNVLGGSMSIVGPRPHAIAVNEQYRRLIPSYMVRHKVKPGITGWAQVNGYRGGDDLESMRGRIDCDLQYLQHWSLGLDLRIMLSTFGLLWSDRAAY